MAIMEIKLSNISDQRDEYKMSVTNTSTGYVYKILNRVNSNYIKDVVVPNASAYIEDDVYHLALNEIRLDSEGLSILRVHNGWVYLSFDKNSFHILSTLFVPQVVFGRDLIQEDSKYRPENGVTSDYQVLVSDYQVTAAAISNDIVITLPPTASTQNYQVFEVINVPRFGHTVKVQMSEGEHFSYGNTYFNLPVNKVANFFGLANHGHHLRNEMVATVDYHVSGVSYTELSGATELPSIKWFETPPINTQPEFYSISNGVITVLSSGEYDFTAMFNYKHASNDSWDMITYIKLNGDIIPNRELVASGKRTDGSATGLMWNISLTAGDRIELIVVNVNSDFDGVLTHGTFSLRLPLG